MKTDLSFNDVRKLVANDSPELLDEIDKLASVIILLSAFAPLPVGGAMAAISLVADLLAVKLEVLQVGKRVFRRFTGKDDESTLSRLRRMEAAYCLICYTAFFDALEELLPELTEAVALTPEEKVALSQSTIKQLNKSEEQGKYPSPGNNCPLLDIPVPLPHPIDSFQAHQERLAPLYSALTKAFSSFVAGLRIWEVASESERVYMDKKIAALPKLALSYFESEYFALASKYNEFFVWANLQEHERTRLTIEEMSSYVRSYIAAVEASRESVDVGLKQMAAVLEQLPLRVASVEANASIRNLGQYYTRSLDDPIVRDPSIPDGDDSALVYPKKSEIFIPQSFKVIRYAQSMHLEQESTWRSAFVRDDLGTFILNYLSSPYSTQAPLVILGHPGSGKSLLTSMLAARLSSSSYLPIRVELRNVRAGNDIAVQIEEQIANDTSRDVTWAQLADTFGRERPPVVILDGYDELLQASGKVFSGYLHSVRGFQEHESRLDRAPVRAIVTSRITLIDKADIPRGATIIRLLEFDEEKQARWASVWNAANHHYFQQTGVAPFVLPKSNPQIKVLAEQPLLLMMLALFDSEGNQLREDTTLDRTLLYDSLLRRFIERERRKDQGFANLTKEERIVEIDREMERLGVAAIGMFNRRSLNIKTHQLNEDLSYLRLERPLQETHERLLSQADLLLGSFFFVHESRALHKENIAQGQKTDAAFEFLHNTFGEFLTADFALRTILNETNMISELRNSEQLKLLLAQKLEDPIGAKIRWFVCFANNAYFSRPTILSMLREWLKHKHSRPAEFIRDLDAIVANQIERILSSHAPPAVTADRTPPSFTQLPMLGHAAVYSVNLILLRTVFSPQPYIFDETMFVPSEDGARAWDRLTHLWRSWFSLESLHGLTAILVADRDRHKIYLTAKEQFSTSQSSDRLTAILNVSRTLADDITTGISGLLVYDSYELDRRATGKIDLETIAAKLEAEHIDLSPDLLTKYVRALRTLQGSVASFGRLRVNRMRRLGLGVSRGSVEATVSLLDELIRVKQDVGLERINQEPQLRGLVRNIANVFGELTYRSSRIEGVFFRDRIATPELLRVFLRFCREFGIRSHLASALISIPSLNISLLQAPWYVVPEVATELLRYARELGDRESLRHAVDRIWREYFHITELGDQESVHYVPDTARRKQMRQLTPSLAVEFVLAVEEVGAGQDLEGFYPMLLAHCLENPSPMLIAQLVRLANIFGTAGDPNLGRFYSEHIRGERFPINSLPLGAVSGLRKLASMFSDGDMLVAIDGLLGEHTSTYHP